MLIGFEATPARRDAVLRVEVGTATGAVFGGAAGMLYGLGEPGIPATPLLEGARPRTVSQKAPGGAQHPTGDALATAEGFFAAGGTQMHIYLQDVYACWPYENPGIEDYLLRVRQIVSLVKASSNADRFAWVPFNEPDWIWYGNWSVDRERFFDHWAAVHSAIRSILPDAIIVGPNEMAYNHERLEDFLRWASVRGLLPDMVSWHELKPAGLAEYRAHHAAYLGLIAKLGLPPIPVIINEYGNRRDFANPAQVIQWLAMFEDTKVDANMAFWTFAGNLDDHVAGIQQANGGWWLLTWYADLTGETVRVVAPHPSTADTLQGIAALDRERRQLDVLFGGTAEPVVVEMRDLPRSVFGTEIDISVLRTTWSGHEGDCMPPSLVYRERRSVSDLMSIALPIADPMGAFRLIVTPVEATQWPSLASWSTRLEAELGALTDAVVHARDADPQEYATSGGSDVGGLSTPDGRIDLEVHTPARDTYVIGVFYGTDERRGCLALWIDEHFVANLDLPSTLTRTHRGRVDHEVELAAGPHLISLRTTGAEGHLDGSDVSVDRVDVTAGGTDLHIYPARLLRTSGGANLSPGDPARPAVVRPAAGEVTAFIATALEGYHDLTVRLLPADVPTSATLWIGEHKLIDAAVASGGDRVVFRVHLAHGVSAVRITGSIAIAALELSPAQAEPESVLVVGVVLDPDREVIRVPRASLAKPGIYNLSLRYTNDARERGHEYNTDVQSVRVEVSEAGGRTVLRSLPYTGAHNVWSIVIGLELETGDGEISVRAISGAPGIHSIELSRVVKPN